jgi:pilus assembly protein CpaC
MKFARILALTIAITGGATIGSWAENSAVHRTAAGDASTVVAPDQGDDMPTGAVRLAAGDPGSRSIALGTGKSIVVELSRDVRDVLVSNPKIANAVIRSSRRAYLIGGDVGQTNIYFFDDHGRQIAGFDIAVTRDLNGIRAALKRMLPHSEIAVEGFADGVVLTGSVGSPVESQRAVDLAARLVGTLDKVVNSLTVTGRDQVMLKVTVAEVQREVIKQLGIDLNGTASFGTSVFNFNNTNPFTVNGGPLTPSAITGNFGSVQATLRAMEQAGIIRTLAEPTLTAISGENANFLAGGKFPVPLTTPGPPPTTSIQWQPFGVSLNFTPVVLSEGRISLKVYTEVSELSNNGAITTNGNQVPALAVRNAETTLELSSGGSLVMAGLIKDQTKQNINGLPGLMALPILGALFKSRDYINSKTELVVIVTPYVVRQESRKKLSQPTDGWADASDPQTVLLGKLNRTYGVVGGPPPGAYRGKVGFILD